MTVEFHNAHMRIPAKVWRRAKRAAARDYQTMTQFTVAALEAAIAARSKKKEEQ